MFRPYMAIIRFFFFNLYSETLRGKKSDDGHIRPKHVVLIQTLEYTSFI